MSEEYPYCVEYSKTARSNCRLCRKSIVNGALRIAAMVQVRNKLRSILYNKLIFQIISVFPPRWERCSMVP